MSDQLRTIRSSAASTISRQVPPKAPSRENDAAAIGMAVSAKGGFRIVSSVPCSQRAISTLSA